MRKANGFLICAVTLLPIGGSPEDACAATLTFHASAPIPDADDVYNFVGASRDGLNVNDDNGLDGPLNDNYTYVANDRPRQGQTFVAPNANNVLAVKSIWLRMVGYSSNGFAPEPGYNGTDADLSAGGEFVVRVLEVGPPISFYAVEDFSLSGNELNNPASTGVATSDNGSGIWLKVVLSPLNAVLAPNRQYAFDIVSRGLENRRFEWLGTNGNAFATGTAYNGTLLGGGPTNTERTMNPLIGDRVFLIELEAVPEPGALALAAGAALLLPRLGRRDKKRGHSTPLRHGICAVAV